MEKSNNFPLIPDQGRMNHGHAPDPKLKETPMGNIPPEAENLAKAVENQLNSIAMGESCFECAARAEEEKKTPLCRACPSGELWVALQTLRARFPDDENLPDDPPHWLTIKEGRRLRICRVCREPAAPKERPNGTMNSFWLGHGHEHSHEDCMTPASRKRMLRKIAETGPHRMD